MERKGKCMICGEEKNPINEFQCCEECWDRVLRMQNIVFGGKGINPWREAATNTTT